MTKLMLFRERLLAEVEALTDELGADAVRGVLDDARKHSTTLAEEAAQLKYTQDRVEHGVQCDWCGERQATHAEQVYVCCGDVVDIGACCDDCHTLNRCADCAARLDDLERDQREAEYEAVEQARFEREHSAAVLG